MGKEYERFQFVPPPSIILPPYLFVDDCEGNIPYLCSGTGSDFVCAYDTVKPFNGTQYLKLRTKSTTPSINDKVTANITLGTYRPKNLSISFNFRITSLSELNTSFYILAYFADFTNSFFPQLNINFPDQQVSFLNSSNSWSVISNLLPSLIVEEWQSLSLSLNIYDGYYNSLVFNGGFYDLSPYELYPFGEDEYIGLHLDLRVFTLAASIAGLDISNITIYSR